MFVATRVTRCKEIDATQAVQPQCCGPEQLSIKSFAVIVIAEDAKLKLLVPHFLWVTGQRGSQSARVTWQPCRPGGGPGDDGYLECLIHSSQNAGRKTLLQVLQGPEMSRWKVVPAQGTVVKQKKWSQICKKNYSQALRDIFLRPFRRHIIITSCSFKNMRHETSCPIRKYGECKTFPPEESAWIFMTGMSEKRYSYF
jgi:hypothetical protein